MTFAQSCDAQKAYDLTHGLQSYFAKRLNELSNKYREASVFVEKQWLRDAGMHGGGSRFEASDKELFNRGSINVSQVHYNDMPKEKVTGVLWLISILLLSTKKIKNVLHTPLKILQESIAMKVYLKVTNTSTYLL